MRNIEQLKTSWRDKIINDDLGKTTTVVNCSNTIANILYQKLEDG